MRGSGDSFLGRVLSISLRFRQAVKKATAAVEDGWVVCCAGGHFVALRLVQSFSKRHFVAFLAKSKKYLEIS